MKLISLLEPVAIVAAVLSFQTQASTAIKKVAVSNTSDTTASSFQAGIPVEVRPQVFIEQGTVLENLNSKEGKMQQMALTYAEIWTTAISDLERSHYLLNGITAEDSHLYFPTGFLTNRNQIEANVTSFGGVAQDVSVWIPANGWSLDTRKQFGRVNSTDNREYYLFTVEVQFRQNRANRVRPEVTNDTWSFFVDKDITHFYQVKEWLDGRVRALQNENVDGTPTLTLDYNTVNATPWPPIFPGKETNLFPITVHSGWITSAPTSVGDTKGPFLSVRSTQPSKSRQASGNQLLENIVR